MSELMAPVAGIECGLPFDKNDRVACISYYDGEITSVYRGNGERYIVAWTDSDERSHRWCVARVSRDRLLAFARGEVSLGDVFRSPEDGHVFIVDADGPKVHRCVRVDPATIEDGFADDGTFPMTEWHDKVPEESM